VRVELLRKRVRISGVKNMKRIHTRWKKDEIKRALNKARLIFKNQYIDIRSTPKSGTLARLLIVTPRASGNAVERNQFRRRVRSLFYELNLSQGTYDWIIFAKPQVTKLSFTELRVIFGELARSLSAPV
jgi:ribonuclease P protein component